MRRRSARVATCPACGKERDLDTQMKLRATESDWVRAERARLPAGWAYAPTDDTMRITAVKWPRDWFWACDRCLSVGKALAANPEKQVLGVGTPFAAYVPRPFVCQDCGAKSVFAPKEQQLWYEGLSFLIWSHPNECPPCRAVRRKKKRTNHALAAALDCLDGKNPDQLDAVAALYEQLGRDARAAEFRARARNVRQRNSPG